MSIENLIRKDLKHFKPYVCARDEDQGHGKVFLNANESAWDYHLSLDHSMLNRYPQKQPQELLEKIAQLYQVETEQLLMLRGSDEAIDLLFRLFCSAREDAVIICPPTFGMYAVGAALQGVDVIEVPLYKAKNYVLNYADILSKWNEKVKIVFLCSPNNPTGNVLNPTDVIALCTALSGKSIVIMDEAYIEFCDQKSMAAYINQCDNLVVLRTLSKAFGLAGARCGFLMAQKEICNWIKRIVPPYPISSMVTDVVTQALSEARLRQVYSHISTTQQEREILTQGLPTLPCVKKIWESAANYILIEVADADDFTHYCEQQGFILRNMHHKPELENCVRITIGKPEENKRLLQILNGYGK